MMGDTPHPVEEAVARVRGYLTLYPLVTAEIADDVLTLSKLVANKDAFDQSSGNQADAYYCLVKGCDADWRGARALTGGEKP